MINHFQLKQEIKLSWFALLSRFDRPDIQQGCAEQGYHYELLCLRSPTNSYSEAHYTYVGTLWLDGPSTVVSRIDSPTIRLIRKMFLSNKISHRDCVSRAYMHLRKSVHGPLAFLVAEYDKWQYIVCIWIMMASPELPIVSPHAIMVTGMDRTVQYQCIFR